MTDRIDTAALYALRKAAGEASGDPARYPRRGIIDHYHSAVVSAYEAGQLVAAAEVLELRAALATAQARITELETLLARNLVMDRGSAEDGADALGGIGAAMDLVAAYHDANPREKEFGDVF